MIRTLSCGIVMTDGSHLLIGHATASPRWDIPKGQAEPLETPEAAARRELTEETGLVAGGVLHPLGLHRYLPRKDLALFLWRADAMPDPKTLECRSYFQRAERTLPEFDRFACPPWAAALPRLGRAMAMLLQGIATREGWL